MCPALPPTIRVAPRRPLAVNCTANLNTRRALNLANPTQSLGNVTSYDDGPTSHYHGLLLSTAWRATNNVNVNANYTWSHCIGVATNGAAVPNAGSNYVHQDNRDLDAGNCAQDRRNVFNLTVIARTPKFANRAVNAAASGWSLSAIYRFSSGAPVTILSGLDQALNGFNANERPNQVLGDAAASGPGAGVCANARALRLLAESGGLCPACPGYARKYRASLTLSARAISSSTLRWCENSASANAPLCRFAPKRSMC